MGILEDRLAVRERLSDGDALASGDVLEVGGVFERLLHLLAEAVIGEPSIAEHAADIGRMLPRQVHPEAEHPELFQDDLQAARVVTVGVGVDHQVDDARPVVAVDVLDQGLARIERPTVDDHNRLTVAGTVQFAVLQRDRVAAPLPRTDGEEIHFKAHDKGLQEGQTVRCWPRTRGTEDYTDTGMAFSARPYGRAPDCP